MYRSSVCVSFVAPNCMKGEVLCWKEQANIKRKENTQYTQILIARSHQRGEEETDAFVFQFCPALFDDD